MLNSRYTGTASVVDGKIYAIGGENARNQIINAVESYNPATNSWTAMAPMPAPEMWLSSAAIKGIIYVVGGGKKVMYAYDVATNKWSKKASLPVNLASPGVGVLNGELYTAGGGGTLSDTFS